jgi:hypothetical protein
MIIPPLFKYSMVFTPVALKLLTVGFILRRRFLPLIKVLLAA